MVWAFKNPWGGALGKLGDGIVELQKAMDGMKQGHFIRIERTGANGWKISYCGKERSGCWSGRIRDEQGNNLITPIDVTSPSNILGKYVCYNYKSGAVDWANVPKGDPEWGCWHVADELTSTGEYGPYTLSPATRGDIVIGGASGLPTPTTENYVLTVNQVWNDSTHEYELKWVEGVVRAI